MNGSRRLFLLISFSPRGDMNKELALVIVTALMCGLLGYVYTIDHTSQSLIFVVISGVSGFWFGKSGGNQN